MLELGEMVGSVAHAFGPLVGVFTLEMVNIVEEIFIPQTGIHVVYGHRSLPRVWLSYEPSAPEVPGGAPAKMAAGGDDDNCQPDDLPLTPVVRGGPIDEDGP